MSRNHRRRLARGFSMLELTFVLIIIGALLAVAAYNFGSQSDVQKARVTRVSLGVIKTALTQYILEQNAPPPTLETLVSARILEAGKLSDAWKRPFLYSPEAAGLNQPFVLFSAGPDGQPSTADDINVWDQ